MSDIAGHIDANYDSYLAELKEFLRIQSISTESGYAEPTRQCAEFVADKVRALGFSGVEVIATEGNPMVVGEHTQQPGAPTLLVYGHYDVQSVDPLELWTDPPFEPSERDGRLYARGAIDDKGQVHMHLKALDTRLNGGSGLPVNVKLVIEGEEEVGSGNLEGFLRTHAEQLACDAVVISDTSMLGADYPSIGTGLRGIAYLDVIVTGPAGDLHSGSYGGAVVNPANALATMIAALRDADGKVTVPGFYDAVRPMTEKERAQVAGLPFSDEEFREEVGASALGGEAGFSTLERIGYRPTLDVNGMISGFTGDGSKTVLPSKASAKISMRLVADQDPDDIAARFAEYFKSLAPSGVSVQVIPSHGGQPWAADPDRPIYEAAAAALETVFGKEPVYIREGGSIPIVSLFEEVFEAPVLLLGFALPGSNAHAPDEWIDLDIYRKGINTIAHFYDEVAARGV